MIDNVALEKIIEYTLWSAYLKEEKPVSLLVIAEPESGKTETMVKFRENNGVIIISDLTYMGLVNLLPRFESGDLKTILIPDMLKIFGRRTEFSSNLVTLLNEFIEEGVLNMHVRDNVIRFSKPVVGNFCASITSTDFFDRIGYWGKLGFVSRIIPFSYGYSNETIFKIFEYIITGQYKNENSIKIKLPKKEKKVNISEDMARLLMPCAVKIASEARLFGFRMQKNLQVLAQSCALSEGCDEVDKTHVDKVIHLTNWINLRRNPLA